MIMPRNILYKKALRLRREGFSYNKIKKELGVQKSTLSYWFSKEDWSIKVKRKSLEKLKELSKTTIKKAHKARMSKTEKRHADFRKQARLEYGTLKERRLFNVGLGIYWGEGNKANRSIVSVSNTDPLLMKIVVDFYRKILHIPNDKLRIGLFSYEDLDEDTLKKYWSALLKVPVKQFIKTQTLKGSNTKRTSKYGICSLYFSSTEMSIKIQEWMRCFSQDKRE
jgi:hypothetical protein